MSHLNRARTSVCIGSYTLIDVPDTPSTELNPQQPGRSPLGLYEPPVLCDPEWRRYYVLQGQARRECGQARSLALQLCRCSYFKLQIPPSANRSKAPGFWVNRNLPAYDRVLSIPSQEYVLVRLFVPLPEALRRCRDIAINPVPLNILLAEQLLAEYGETGQRDPDVEKVYRGKRCERVLEFIGETVTAIWTFAEARHLDLRDLGDHYNSPSKLLMDHLLAFRQAMVDFNTPASEKFEDCEEGGGSEKTEETEETEETEDAAESDASDEGTVESEETEDSEEDEDEEEDEDGAEEDGDSEVQEQEAYAGMNQAISHIEEMIRRVLQDTKQKFWAQWPVPTQVQLEAAAARMTGQSPVPCDICAI